MLKYLSHRTVGPYALLVLLSLSVPSLTSAQHDHGDEANSVYERFQKPQVKYQLQAELLPREGLIRGWMDINWTNLSNDTIRSISLDFGFSPYDDSTTFDFHAVTYAGLTRANLTGDRRSYCWLDSVLYQAARLDQPARMSGSSLMELPLPRPIYPGQSGPLAISFETRFKPIADSAATNSLWLPITQWFPHVALYANGRWRSTADLEGTDDHALASYAISLSVDSAFHIIGSGELMNEKEHFGTMRVPKGDTVNVNVTSFLYAFNPDHPYVPKFEGGKKGYHFRLLNGNNFPILLAKQIRIDRAQVDGQQLEIVYPFSVAAAWRRRVGTEARTAFAALSDKLGHYPYPVLRIVALPEGEGSPGQRELIFLSERIAGNSDIRKALTHLIARAWLADFLNLENSDSAQTGFFAYDEALGLILAEDVKTGFKESGTIGPAEKVSLSVDSWSLSTPFWIDRVKTRLNDLILAVGQKKFLSLVARLSSSHQFRPVSKADFMKIVAETCGDKGLELIGRKRVNRSANSLDLHRAKTDNQ